MRPFHGPCSSSSTPAVSAERSHRCVSRLKTWATRYVICVASFPTTLTGSGSNRHFSFRMPSALQVLPADIPSIRWPSASKREIDSGRDKPSMCARAERGSSNTPWRYKPGTGTKSSLISALPANLTSVSHQLHVLPVQHGTLFVVREVQNWRDCLESSGCVGRHSIRSIHLVSVSDVGARCLAHLATSPSSVICVPLSSSIASSASSLEMLGVHP